MSNPTVREMTEAQLKAGGYDGLTDGCDCNCWEGFENALFMFCESADLPEHCKAGYLVNDVHIQLDKPEKEEE